MVCWPFRALKESHSFTLNWSSQSRRRRRSSGDEKNSKRTRRRERERDPFSSLFSAPILWVFRAHSLRRQFRAIKWRRQPKVKGEERERESGFAKNCSLGQRARPKEQPKELTKRSVAHSFGRKLNRSEQKRERERVKVSN